jgi:voltage-gated potassium channel
MPSGRVVHPFEGVAVVLALLVIPVVLIEESHPSHALRLVDTGLNWFIWVGFLTELIFVVAVAKRRRAAVRAHWLEVVIVVVTPPFLPGILGVFRLARLIRLLRLMRLGVLGGKALSAERTLTSRQGFRYLALLTGLLVVTAGASISAVDSGDFPNVWRGMWWAVETVTTVGYGDYTPHSVSGRIVAVLLMLVGIGFLSILTATIASSFVSRDAETEQTADKRDHNEVLDALRRIEARLEVIERRSTNP